MILRWFISQQRFNFKLEKRAAINGYILKRMSWGVFFTSTVTFCLSTNSIRLDWVRSFKRVGKWPIDVSLTTTGFLTGTNGSLSLFDCVFEPLSVLIIHQNKTLDICMEAGRLSKRFGNSSLTFRVAVFIKKIILRSSNGTKKTSEKIFHLKITSTTLLYFANYAIDYMEKGLYYMTNYKLVISLDLCFLLTARRNTPNANINKRRSTKSLLRFLWVRSRCCWRNCKILAFLNNK